MVDEGNEENCSCVSSQKAGRRTKGLINLGLFNLKTELS